MNNKVNILLKEGACAPEYQTAGASGADLCANENANVEPFSRRLISTGVSLEMPKGIEAQVRPRSSLSRCSIDVALGTIDSDYRGEVKVCLANYSMSPYKIKKGQRIAQLVFAPVLQVKFNQVTELSDTDRGTGGFGSTGK